MINASINLAMSYYDSQSRTEIGKMSMTADKFIIKKELQTSLENRICVFLLTNLNFSISSSDLIVCMKCLATLAMYYITNRLLGLNTYNTYFTYC